MHLDEYQKKLKDLCRKQPEKVEAWVQLAQVNAQLGDFTDAIHALERALEIEPRNAEICYRLGNLYIAEGDMEKARTLLQRAVRIDPGHADALNNLALIYKKSGMPGEAEEIFRRLIAQRPQSHLPCYNLANLCMERARPQEALDLYRRAVGLNPDFVDTYAGLAAALNELGRVNEAIDCYLAVLARNPSHRVALNGLGLAYQRSGDLERAEDCYRKSLALAPEDAKARAGLAEVLDRYHRLEEAHGVLLPALGAAHPDVDALLVYASLAVQTGKEDDAINRLQSAMHITALPDKDRLYLHFALGKLLDRRGRYAEAFDQYRQGNQLHPARFDAGKHEKFIDDIIRHFNGPAMRSLPRATVRNIRPVFIVGMPRSGTTLVEQVLASHSQATPGGERPDIENFVHELPVMVGDERGYPACVDRISGPQLDQLTSRYLQGFSACDPPPKVVTDKMPQNFMHLGLIELLFPDARIIHCLRDPRDTCLSCYFQNFSGSQFFSYRLQNLVAYYDLYRKVMRHWREVIRTPMMEVRYEDMIQDMDSKIRAILEFCDLPWEDGCARFYENKRTVLTSSYAQVRRPVYPTSVGRWKHYQSFIGNKFDGLAR